MEVTPELLAKLPPRMRAVVELAVEGIPCSEIADRLGLSPSTVATQARGAKRRLGGWFRGRGRPNSAGEGAFTDPGDDETPREARARISRELAEGKRCTHPLRRGPCSLFLPCADHEP